MTNGIPRWKVQAALRLLGLDPAEALGKFSEVSITPDQVNWNEGYADVTDTVEDTRVHVLGIDPETGNAELNPVPDDDVTFFCGANMYLHSGTLHKTGTKMPVFKRRS